MLIDIFPRARARFLKHPPARRSSRRAGPTADRAGATAPADPYSYLQGRLCSKPCWHLSESASSVNCRGNVSSLWLPDRPRIKRASCQRSYGPWPGFWLTVALCGG